MSLGPLDLWMQWWLGYVRNNVPPLKILQGRDVYHLHFIMAEEGCWVTRKGCKILCHIRFLMVYLENKDRYWKVGRNSYSVLSSGNVL